MRKITIRIDDVTEDMDWDKFQQFTAVLERHQIKPLLGVIPKNKDESLCCNQRKENFGAWLRERKADGWVLAMHGYDHCYVTKVGGMFPLNHFSEFAGVSYEEQKKKIEAGKAALEELGIITNIFMAPGHTYDKTTLQVLKECGFTHVTDGFGSSPYLWNGITFFPIAKRRSAELKAAKGYTTFVVHTATMKEQDMQSYDELLTKYRSHFVDYAEYYQQKVVKKSVIGRWAEYSLASLKYRLLNS